MRLIDADELKQAETRISAMPWGDWQGHKVGFTWMPHEVQRLIDRAPTIDAVEVVRCKDCIMTRTYDFYSRGNWCIIHRNFMQDDYFCADGRREP